MTAVAGACAAGASAVLLTGAAWLFTTAALRARRKAQS